MVTITMSRKPRNRDSDPERAHGQSGSLVLVLQLHGHFPAQLMQVTLLISEFSVSLLKSIDDLLSLSPQATESRWCYLIRLHSLALNVTTQALASMRMQRRELQKTWGGPDGRELGLGYACYVESLTFTYGGIYSDDRIDGSACYHISTYNVYICLLFALVTNVGEYPYIYLA